MTERYTNLWFLLTYLNLPYVRLSCTSPILSRLASFQLNWVAVSALWSDPVRRGCDQSEHGRSQRQRNGSLYNVNEEMKYAFESHEWDELSDERFLKNELVTLGVTVYAELMRLTLVCVLRYKTVQCNPFFISFRSYLCWFYLLFTVVYCQTFYRE